MQGSWAVPDCEQKSKTRPREGRRRKEERQTDRAWALQSYAEGALCKQLSSVPLRRAQNFMPQEAFLHLIYAAATLQSRYCDLCFTDEGVETQRGEVIYRRQPASGTGRLLEQGVGGEQAAPPAGLDGGRLSGKGRQAERTWE